MSIGLNTFLLEEVESFPDDPYPTIDFIKVNEKLTLLELRLVYGDDVTIDAANELKEKFLDAIWYLLEHDCRFLKRVGKEEDLGRNYDFGNVILIMRTSSLPDNANSQDNIFSYVDEFTLILTDPLNEDVNSSSPTYMFNGKLMPEQEIAMWRLIYAIFNYKFLEYSIYNLNSVEVKTITIPFNDSQSQIDILQRLMEPVLIGMNLARYYEDPYLWIHVSTRSNEDTRYLISSSLNVESEYPENIARFDTCNADDVEGTVEMVVRKYIDSL